MKQRPLWMAVKPPLKFSHLCGIIGLVSFASIVFSRSFFMPTLSKPAGSKQFLLSSSLPFFQPDRSSSLSCPFYENKPTPFPVSFWYVKSFKTGSSTLAGVFRSIGAHHGVSMLNPKTAFMVNDETKQAITDVYEWHEHVGLANHIHYSLEVAGTKDV